MRVTGKIIAAGVVLTRQFTINTGAAGPALTARSLANAATINFTVPSLADGVYPISIAVNGVFVTAADRQQPAGGW